MRNKKIIFFIFLVLFLFLFFFIISYYSKPTITGNTIYENLIEISVYFCPEDMCKEKLINEIEKSTEIKCAFYELNLNDVIEKLKEKNAKVIIEDSTYEKNKNLYKINNETDENFLTGFSKALMHNKFCIFDNKTIFTGSMNPTFNDNYLNNNNILFISSKKIAKNYLDEFQELEKNIYGKGNKVKNPLINTKNIRIENYFCPEDNCKLHVINELKKANKSIYFMTFSFTDEDIGNLIWNKYYLGLDVKGIFDKSQITNFSVYNYLKEFSIIDTNKYKLHNKVFIIDNQTIITGSYNPTRNANDYNDENLIIIENKEIAEKYIFNFLKIYNNKNIKFNNSLFLNKILPNPKGKDENNEFVELKNLGEDIDLSYYSISDNKSTMRLTGFIKSNQTIIIKPQFSLKNSNGSLYLLHNNEIIDYVLWHNSWNSNPKEGQILIRKDYNISNNSWYIY